MYLDPAREKNYVLPWHPSFDVSRYTVEFPTPPSSDADEEGVGDDEMLPPDSPTGGN